MNILGIKQHASYLKQANIQAMQGLFFIHATAIIRSTERFQKVGKENFLYHLVRYMQKRFQSRTQITGCVVIIKTCMLMFNSIQFFIHTI